MQGVLRTCFFFCTVNEHVCTLHSRDRIHSSRMYSSNNLQNIIKHACTGAAETVYRLNERIASILVYRMCSLQLVP